MRIRITKSSVLSSDNIVLLLHSTEKLLKFGLSKEELEYVRKEIKSESKQIVLNLYKRWVFIQLIEKSKIKNQTLEELRKAGDKLCSKLRNNKLEQITIIDVDNLPEETLAYAEGIALGDYQFLKYKKDVKKESSTLKTIKIDSKSLSTEQINNLLITVEATCLARDLVNEPASYLNALQLSKEIQNLGKEAGFKVEVFNKSKIESLKMGGLLAVNRGSIDPPTFTIMEWKPKNHKNKKPYILVGKGVVYDTGGLSLKPTLNSMDSMKSDMAGAAAVSSTMYAIAKSKLPVYVIGMVPATDNRPGGNAYAPGDVIQMHNGLNVEMLNADAEGRMILADALSYAKKFNPTLVIDLATLTGAAASAIGHYGIVCMGTAAEETKNSLKESGEKVYERLVEFPLWEEYGDLLKSDIADLKNIGGSTAGAITAGKFLQHFVDYPWIHFDIAGPSFIKTIDSYRGKNASGVGVRLLFDFLKKQSTNS